MTRDNRPPPEPMTARVITGMELAFDRALARKLAQQARRAAAIRSTPTTRNNPDV